jgi:hypothetical protein
MDIETAIRTAEQHVAQFEAHSGLTLQLFRDKTIEREFGWVFFYGPEDKAILVAGNAPFIVDRKSGVIHETGTAYPLEDYLESYARVGRTYPFAVPEHLVIIEGWKPGLPKVSLTKAIREAPKMGLQQA